MYMIRKNPFLLIPVAIGLVIGIYVSYQLIRFFMTYDPDRQKLFVGCYSDKLSEIATAYQAAIQENKEGWPNKDQVISKLRPDAKEWLLTCNQNNQPFVWCESTLNLKQTNPYPVPLVWCPPGAHGKYVGVVLLRDGEIRYEIMTESDRQHLIPPER